MAKDLNHDIPVTNGAYSGSDRAKRAMSAAHQGEMHTPMTGPGPKSMSDQTDRNVKNPGDRAVQSNKTQTSDMSPMPTLAKPLGGATPPNRINPNGRPGLGAAPIRKKG